MRSIASSILVRAASSAGSGVHALALSCCASAGGEINSAISASMERMRFIDKISLRLSIGYV